jgi:hypothetical protein
MGSGCDNLLGMSFEGGRFPLAPIVVTIAVGVAVGWLLGFEVSKLRSRSA